MYYEFTNSGLVTLTLTMLVSVLPYIVPSGSVPLLGVSNSTMDYLLNSTESTLLSTTNNISETITSLSPSENYTSPVLLSQSSTAETSTLETTGIESTQLPSSVPSSTSSSYTLLRSSSTSSSPSNSSSTTTVSDSQSVNNVTLVELASNRSSSSTPSHLSSSTMATSSSTVATSPVPLPVRTTKARQPQSALEIILVKKLLQKWGYMPIKKNGCWIYEDWRKEAVNSVNPSPVTCPSTQSNPITTLSSAETSTTYESISELATSELSLSESKDSRDDDIDIPGLSGEEREKFVDSVFQFQERNRLPKTGRLDASTESVINRRICGVPDNPNAIIEDEDESGNETDASDQSTSASPTTNTIRSRQMPSTILSTLLGVVYSTSRTEIQSDYETVTDLASVTMETELSYTDIVTEMSSELGSMVSELDETTPTTSNVERTLFTDGKDGLPSAETSRRKRQSLSNTISGSGSVRHRLKRSTQRSMCLYRWQHSTIYWRIQSMDASNPYGQLTTSSDFTSETLRRNISEAFRRWSEVSTLRFVEASPGMTVNIYLRFIAPGVSTPTGCSIPEGCFLGNEMATSTRDPQGYYHYIYFKEDPFRPWSFASTSTNTVDLPTVATHEIGHTLCLPHNYSNHGTSIMNPVSFVNSYPGSKVVIDEGSRLQMKNYYGGCTDKFVAFDWVKRVNGYLRYSTYMFRGDHYWRWVNSERQTRSNDPRKLYESSSEWRNIPINPYGSMQAIVHVKPRYGSTNDLFFFSGGRSIKYHQTGNYVIEDQAIEQRWRKKTGSSFPNIPRDIKAAYFDKTNGNVYFFNSTHVFAYDMSLGEAGCCLDNPVPISTAYQGFNSWTYPMENDIDGAYYSIYDHILYFFKGDTYWESTYDPHPDVNRGGSAVKVKGKQYNKHMKWSYLCEVDHSFRS